MSNDIHPTTIAIADGAPTSVAVDENFVVTIKVSCAHGCDLHGLPVTVTAPGGAVAAIDTDGINEGTIELKAPRTVGEHSWRIAVQEHERDGVRHGESGHTLTVKIEPHATSLAVWDIPSPAVVGEPFAIKVGAKSVSGCTLEGKSVEVCDAAGAVLARAQFGPAPWPGTSALYWIEVALPAPAAEGIVAWSARFAGADLDLPHEGSSSHFSLAAVRRPEHTLTVKVVEKDSAQPVEDVQVLAGPYRAPTSAAGLACIRVPKGTYELAIWKVGYEAEPRTLTVDADAAVEIAAVVVPEEDPDAHWQM